MAMEEIKAQLETWLRDELQRVEAQFQKELQRVESQFSKELKRVDGEVFDLRMEVSELLAQVGRGNAINLETQGGLAELRREAQTGFDGVHDSLVELIALFKEFKKQKESGDADVS